MIKAGLVTRNVLATLITQGLSWVLTFVVTLYLPKYVGATGLGQLTFAVSFAGILAVVVPLGTNMVLVKEISRDRELTAPLIATALAVRLPLALTMAALTVGVAVLLRQPAPILVLIAIAAAATVVTTTNDVLASALKGQEKVPRQSLAMLVEKILSAILTIALVILKGPLWAIAAVAIVSALASLTMNASAFAYLRGKFKPPSLASARSLVTAGMPYMGWSIFFVLYSQTDPLVLKVVSDDTNIGWYALANRLGGTALFLPRALTAALLPTLSRLYSSSTEEFQLLARRMLSLVILCGIPIAFVLLLMPEQILALLHYPSSFAGSVATLRVSGLGVMMDSVALVMGTTVIASDGQWRMARASMLACAIGIPLCAGMSYASQQLWGNGAAGAMASDVVLEFYLLVAYLTTVPRGTFGSGHFSFILRCLVASIPVALCLLAARHTPVGLWALLPSVPLYFLGCWWLRCLDPAYFNLLRRLANKQSPA